MDFLDATTMELLRPMLIGSEGLRLRAYRCPAGVWTIGYGHTGPEVVEGMTIKKVRADELLEADLEWVDTVLANTVKVPLAPAQKAAIASLTFNIGAAAWRASTCLRRINAGNATGAAEALVWFNQMRDAAGNKVVSDGLVARRERERALFLTAIRGVYEEEPTASGTVTGGEHKKARWSVTTWLSGLSLGGILMDAASSFASIRAQAPEIIQHYGVHIVVGLLVAGILLRRMQEAKAGVH